MCSYWLIVKNIIHYFEESVTYLNFVAASYICILLGRYGVICNLQEYFDLLLLTAFQEIDAHFMKTFLHDAILNVKMLILENLSEISHN